MLRARGSRSRGRAPVKVWGLWKQMCMFIYLFIFLRNFNLFSSLANKQLRTTTGWHASIHTSGYAAKDKIMFSTYMKKKSKGNEKLI